MPAGTSACGTPSPHGYTQQVHSPLSMPEPALSVWAITVAPAALAIVHASITSRVLPEWLQAITRDFSPKRLGRMISNSRAVYASLVNVVASRFSSS